VALHKPLCSLKDLNSRISQKVAFLARKSALGFFCALHNCAQHHSLFPACLFVPRNHRYLGLRRAPIIQTNQKVTFAVDYSCDLLFPAFFVCTSVDFATSEIDDHSPHGVQTTSSHQGPVPANAVTSILI
jgi:hypothetical protein